MKQKLIFLLAILAPFFAAAQTPDLVGPKDMPGSYLALAGGQSLYQLDPAVRAAFASAHPNIPTTVIQAGVAYELFSSGIHGWDHLEQAPSGHYRVVWATGQRPAPQWNRPDEDGVRLAQPDDARLDELADWAAELSQKPLTSGVEYQSPTPSQGSLWAVNKMPEVLPYRVFTVGTSAYSPTVEVLGVNHPTDLWSRYTFQENDETLVAHIASLFGIPVKVLLEINGIVDDRHIMPGQTLWIPAGIPQTKCAILAPMGMYPLYVQDLFGCSLFQQIGELYQPGQLEAYANIPTGYGYRIVTPDFEERVVKGYVLWHNRVLQERELRTPDAALGFFQDLKGAGDLSLIRDILFHAQLNPEYATPEQVADLLELNFGL